MKFNDLDLIIPDGPYCAPHTTIQSAIDAALVAPNAAVWIRADYPGTDTYTNPNNVQIFDNRVKGAIDPILQGLLADLPILEVGQSYFATDVQILYIGTSQGNAPTTALPLTGPTSGLPPDAPAGFLYFATDTIYFIAFGQGTISCASNAYRQSFAEIGVLVTGQF
jgi:hypothetical protein